jgi:hypothetical protein
MPDLHAIVEIVVEEPGRDAIVHPRDELGGSKQVKPVLHAIVESVVDEPGRDAIVHPRDERGGSKQVTPVLHAIHFKRWIKVGGQCWQSDCLL